MYTYIESRVSYRIFGVYVGGRGGGGKFVGHCHRVVMHEFAAHVLSCQITCEQRLHKFSSILGGTIPGPPPQSGEVCMSSPVGHVHTP